MSWENYVNDQEARANMLCTEHRLKFNLSGCEPTVTGECETEPCWFGCPFNPATKKKV